VPLRIVATWHQKANCRGFDCPALCAANINGVHQMCQYPEAVNRTFVKTDGGCTYINKLSLGPATIRSDAAQTMPTCILVVLRFMDQMSHTFALVLIKYLTAHISVDKHGSAETVRQLLQQVCRADRYMSISQAYKQNVHERTVCE
jgi:hypothetical protein